MNESSKKIHHIYYWLNKFIFKTEFHLRSIHTINQSIKRAIEQSINQAINQSVNHTQSINQSSDQSINQSHTINQSIKRSINQSITHNQSINRAISQSINQSTGQSILLFKQCMKHECKNQSNTWNNLTVIFSFTACVASFMMMVVSFCIVSENSVKSRFINSTMAADCRKNLSPPVDIAEKKASTNCIMVYWVPCVTNVKINQIVT